MIYNVQVKDKRGYDRLMTYLEGKGYTWMSGKKATAFDGRAEAKEKHKSKLTSIVVDSQLKKFGYIHGDPGQLPPEVEDVAYAVLKERLEAQVDADKAAPTHPRTYRLLKETVELRKGALVQEINPEREYVVISKDFIKFPEDCKLYFRPGSLIRFSRMTVETQKGYFEEVYPADVYLNEAELQKFIIWAKRNLKG